MFDDKIVNYGRIVIAIAFAVHLQQHFDVDLKTEATKIIEDRFCKLRQMMIESASIARLRFVPLIDFKIIPK